MKTLIEKLRICAIIKSFFCRHKWDDFEIRKLDEPKMDDKGRFLTKKLIRTCSKCGKIEHFAMSYLLSTVIDSKKYVC